MSARPAGPTTTVPLLSLRQFRTGYWFGGFNGLTWMVCLGTPMVLLAEQLGATTFQVGLASSFVFLLLPVQVLSTTTLQRLGFRRQMVTGWIVRAAFLLVPLGIAWGAPGEPHPMLVNLLVASVFGFCFFRAFGAAAHIAWFSAILPLQHRGRFFATDHAITSAVGVVALLSCALVFDLLPGYGPFRVVYAVAIVGSSLAVWNLLRLPDTPAPAPTPLARLGREAAELSLRPGIFRQYLLLSLMGAAVTSATTAFTVYYLKVEAGVESSRILLFSAAQFAGQILGTWSIRHFIDRLPVRHFLQLGTVAYACVNVYWLALVTGRDTLLPFAALAYAAFGAAAGVSNAAHFTFLPELSSEERRPVSVAVFTAILGLCSGLSPMIWGGILKGEGASPGMDLEAFALYFALGLALSAMLVILLARLPDRRLEGEATQAGDRERSEAA